MAVTRGARLNLALGRRCGNVAAMAAWLLPLTLLRLLVAAATPLAPDEAYYWVWSRALAPGYLDHPPMVALWIRAGTSVGGDGAFGVRLLSPLAAALGSFLLFWAAEDLLPGRRAGAWAAALLNATLLLGVGAVTMTPDTPLLLFWTAALWALCRFHATGNGAWWLVAGVVRRARDGQQIFRRLAAPRGAGVARLGAGPAALAAALAALGGRRRGAAAVRAGARLERRQRLGEFSAPGRPRRATGRRRARCNSWPS